MIEKPRHLSIFRIPLQRTALTVTVGILICVFSLRAQDRRDLAAITFTERFGRGSDRLYLSTNLRNFSQRLDSLARTDSIGRIDVTGYASIDGNENQNEMLANGRAYAMKRWLMEQLPSYPAGDISTLSSSHDWMLLRQLVIDDTEVPSRDDAISVMESDSAAETKVARLKSLAGGETWQYLVKYIFPHMRVATVKIEAFRRRSAEAEKPLAATETFPMAAPEPARPVADEVTEVTEVTEVAEIVPEALDCRECGTQRLALKTNLLYDAALMPSLEVEYIFNDRWSVGLEGNIAWWDNDSRHRYYRIMTLTPEVRYHFKSDKTWHGHYLGLFAGGGKYDFENGAHGYQGTGGYIGVSYNYMWNVSKYFSLELGLGVGGMCTEYKEYIPKEGRYVYQRTNRMWYGGPLRLKFGLVWRLWDVKCKERKQR